MGSSPLQRPDTFHNQVRWGLNNLITLHPNEYSLLNGKKVKRTLKRNIFRHKKPIIEVLEDSGGRRGGQWGVPLSSLFDIRPIFIVWFRILTIGHIFSGIIVTPIPCARFHQLPWDFQVTYINTVLRPRWQQIIQINWETYILLNMSKNWANYEEKTFFQVNFFTC